MLYELQFLLLKGKYPIVCLLYEKNILNNTFLKSLAAKICLIVIDLATNKYFHYLYALIFFIIKI